MLPWKVQGNISCWIMSLPERGGGCYQHLSHKFKQVACGRSGIRAALRTQAAHSTGDSQALQKPAHLCLLQAFCWGSQQEAPAV